MRPFGDDDDVLGLGACELDMMYELHVCVWCASGWAGALCACPPTARSLDGGRATILTLRSRRCCCCAGAAFEADTSDVMRMMLLSLHQR